MQYKDVILKVVVNSKVVQLGNQKVASCNHIGSSWICSRNTFSETM